MTQKEWASELQIQLAAANRAGAGRPFPEQLRRAVVDFAAEAIAEGENSEEVSRELGISAMSVKRWTVPIRSGVVKREPLRACRRTTRLSGCGRARTYG